jgi:hypothetical protein
MTSVGRSDVRALRRIEYWLLDPHIDGIERYSHVAGEYERTLCVGPREQFESVVLAGFSCPVDSLFSW